MERTGDDLACYVFVTELGEQALTDLFCRFVGEGNREDRPRRAGAVDEEGEDLPLDLLRRHGGGGFENFDFFLADTRRGGCVERVPVFDEESGASDEDGRFPAPRSREDEQRPLGLKDRLALRRVEMCAVDFQKQVLFGFEIPLFQCGHGSTSFLFSYPLL